MQVETDTGKVTVLLLHAGDVPRTPLSGAGCSDLDG
jgi:hypothetical protein